MTERRFRSFPKSWGAEFVRHDEARFRIWAPGQRSLHLELGDERMPMERNDEGWFELVAGGVAPGMPYRFVLDDGLAVPDPAARAQRADVHGPSLLVDPASYDWRNPLWTGRAWEETVIYELHVGTFTPQGTFAAARERLGYLADLGVTAIELMPVAQFSGNRGWGYDGVLLYAPHNAYGTPDEMKALVDEAHGLGMTVLLDVVYNHFGPDGNYLHAYAPDFFHPERHTPWGAAIAYERAPVRDFFMENALYWLEEYHLDGLRFDAIDHIRDEGSEPEFMVEIARRIREQVSDREIHLTTEDNRNVTHLHARHEDGSIKLHSGEWNDDFHNVAHVIATGEGEGYYEDFVTGPWAMLARSLAEGFAYQGEPSAHAGGAVRGQPSAHMPPTAFVNFLQNHDQVGNRAFGERLDLLADARVIEMMQAILILSPQIPMIFMGEEYGETRPFLFFTDFQGDLADAVREGRRREFARFAAFAGAEAVPDPNAQQTRDASTLDWSRLEDETHAARHARMRSLLGLRKERIVSLLRNAGPHAGTVLAAEDGVLAVDWTFGRERLCLRANFGETEREVPAPQGEAIHSEPPSAQRSAMGGKLPARCVIVTCTNKGE